jgi:hypothetical protein
MDAIDKTLGLLVERGKTPSVQYLRFDQKKIIHVYGAGFADMANQIPASVNNTYD